MQISQQLRGLCATIYYYHSVKWVGRQLHSAYWIHMGEQVYN